MFSIKLRLHFCYILAETGITLNYKLQQNQLKKRAECHQTIKLIKQKAERKEKIWRDKTNLFKQKQAELKKEGGRFNTLPSSGK